VTVRYVALVVIGLSPPLAYCAIFSVMSSDVVDFHICICMCVPSYQPLIVPVCMLRLRCCTTEVTWSIYCFENDRANYLLSRQTLLSEDIECCESWRDAELGDCAVCLLTCGDSGSQLVGVAIRLTKHGSRTAELFYVFSVSTETLSWAVWRTIRWSHSIQVRVDTTTDARHHRPTTPAVHGVAVVYYAISTTCLLLCACCLTLAT